jgi:bleomycin hydrolase
MKRFEYLNCILISSFFLFNISANAQNTNHFTDIKRLPVTSVKNQNQSSTCWSFSGLAFLEAEMLRIGKKDVPDLSPMYVVRNCYYDKALKYVRMQGNINFAGGGVFHDVIHVLKDYGLVPEEIYSGLKYGEKNHVHGEIDEILKDFCVGIVKNPGKKLSTAWRPGFNGLLDAYFGPIPAKFIFRGKEYTPKSFASDFIGLNADDYVEISSFTHHPYYEPFILEIPDNWLWEKVYNVQMEDLTKIIDYSIDNGYAVAWGTDYSENGFLYYSGLAYIDEKNDAGDEIKVSPELRQQAFDNYQTTDDHGMLICGTAKDQNKKKYYIVKNSWGESNLYKGYLYVTEAYVLYKTTCLMVNKNAIPKDIRTKLKI